MKHLLVRALTLFAFAYVSLATHAALLHTPENIPLSVPAASVAADGVPGSTNLAGTNFIMSAVLPATSRGGSASLINTQQWVRRFTNNPISQQSGSYAMALRPDGGVIVTGGAYNTTNAYNILTLGYAADGTPLWTNFYDGTNHSDDFPSGIAVDANGDVWIAGDSARDATSLNTDVALLCYASNGIPLWTNRYNSGNTNSDAPLSLALDGSGNAYLEVQTISWAASGEGTPVANTMLKFDRLGNPISTNVFLSAAPDSGQAPHEIEAFGVDPAGDLFIAGRTGSQYFNTGSALLKLAPDGTPLWTNYMAFGFMTLFRTVQFDLLGDVIATGERFSTNSTIPYVVMKYSSATGNPLWTNIMVGPAYDGGDVPQTLVIPTCDVLLVGGATGATNTGFYQIIKFDSNGVPVWTNLNANFGTNSELYAATVNNAGELYLVALAPDPINSSRDYATTKYSSSGQPLWTNFYDGPAGGEDDPAAIVVNGMGEVFVTGQSDGSNGRFESTTVAYADALTYVPPTNHTSLDNIRYTLTDAFGSSAPGSVLVLVTGTRFDLVPVGFGLSGFQLAVEGAPGTNVVIIQASTDLVHWQSLCTNAPIQGVVQYLDTSASGFAERFYRAEQLP